MWSMSPEIRRRRHFHITGESIPLAEQYHIILLEPWRIC
jgi:hypothetical protein